MVKLTIKEQTTEGIYLIYFLTKGMRHLLATTMMLLMMTAALAGCAGSDVTQEDVDAAYEDGRAAGIAEIGRASCRERV